MIYTMREVIKHRQNVGLPVTKGMWAEYYKEMEAISREKMREVKRRLYVRISSHPANNH